MNAEKIDVVTIGKWFLLACLIWAVLSLLNKFGLLGKTQDEKDANKLLNEPMLSGNSTNQNPIVAAQVAAAIKVPSNKVTQADVNKFMSPSGVWLKWKNDLLTAKGTFDDDEEKIYGVLRQIKNQADLYGFAQFFLVQTGTALIDWLNDVLSTSELAIANNIISKIPKVK